MAQLSDDCFAFGGPLMTLEQAADLMATRLRPVVEAEAVGLMAAFGRILAEDLVAPAHVPPHDNSAVDGYAVHFDDLSPDTETRLDLADGRAAAGHAFDGVVPRGQGGKWALEGRTAVGGSMPINPSGGLLAKGHPVGAM